MKKVLVTGANGYIGNNVVVALKAYGAHVVAVDLNKGNHMSDANYIQGDIFADPSGLLKSVGPVDACLHLAWRNGFDHNAPSHFADLSAHFCFLEAVIGSGIKQIAVMGTMHEVGYWEGEINDQTPCDPQSLYGIAKDSLRRAFFQLVSDKDIYSQWLRGFYIYGEDEKSQSIFGKILRAARNGEKSFPFTSGKNQYDFLHIDIFAKQIAACLMQDKVLGVINCCSGKPVSLSDQIESFIKANNLEISLDYGAYPDRAYDSPGIWGDNQKITDILTA